MLLKKIFKFFHKEKLPVITQATLVSELLQHYPAFDDFLFDRVGRKTTSQDAVKTFQSFTHDLGLPSAQILFMEFQMHCRSSVRSISPRQLHTKMTEDQKLVLIDAREGWEREFGSLPRSRPLNGALLDELVRTWPKDTPLALYCHYGIRSMDAAIFLADQGFENVKALSGGVEAWSQQIDPTFPRYPGQPC